MYDGALSLDATVTDGGFDSARFFDVVLPAMLAEKRHAAARIGGVVQFHLVRGETSCGYVLDGSVDAPTVVEGEDAHADVVLTIDERLVLPLIHDALDVEQALASGLLALHGDLGVWERVSALFGSAFSGMGALYASVGETRSGDGR